MSFKQEIRLLINAINSDTSIDEVLKKRKIVLLSNLLDSANKYISIVVKQGYLLQVNEGTIDRDTLEELAELDKSRSRAHDSLIYQVTIVNRLCAEYGLESICKGGENRREKGDIALDLVTEYFRDRV